MGPTKVFKTRYDQPDSIRGKFGLTDTRNSSHGSDSEETARAEINFFFPEFNIDEFYQSGQDIEFLRKVKQEVYDSILLCFSIFCNSKFTQISFFMCYI